ncbi:Putative zinc- or iron-chelating domain-containing protein [Desulfonema limicola]|uniref:Zinc- or iron-chelating domain-containing protein n=1 Tax=Desulfonema limicola TaxID=45656 RepID=A0A975B3J1_9BACT|nr:YkgJ family cysteine cluster protein [Desulfonema limicola]QTA78130.1 Putative zinc- or iron-chelating domain-containing protein [Desulfonema limicola]
MNLDLLNPFFKQYEELLKTADTIFDKVKSDFPDCVKCHEKCSDCCHALFDLTLIEALYINHHFNEKYKGEKHQALTEKADKADRQIYKIKKKAYKDLEAGKKEDDILAEIAEERVRCPLLNELEMCDLYEHRPITCRFYGIPTSIAGKGHTCGKSAFQKGNLYPTVNLDIIQKKLYDLSDQIVKAMQSKYIRLSEMIIPLSMAMITSYDDEYLGIKE